jgi:hypothetical protein
MWNPNALSTSPVHYGQSYVLSEEILAMELAEDGTGDIRLGPLSALPEGVEIELCGDGFNDRTAKIRWRGRFYFIFLQDLENQSALAQYAWS